jgi:acyl dehydratase
MSRPGIVLPGHDLGDFDPAALAVGDAIPSYVDTPTTRTDIVRYQGASGDMNPIHHDDGYAALGGYDSAFSVGMLQAGVLGTYVADLFGAGNVRKYRAQFREQVWPGDTLTYSGKVVDISTEDNGRTRLDLELFATKQTGGVHIFAWMTVAV